MMGRSHALSGAAVGLWLAPLAGLTELATAVPLAVVVAGYAIAPDIDCGGATISRMLGPITKLLSKLCVVGSKRLYRATATEHDDHSKTAGGHRGVTHLLATALLLVENLLVFPAFIVAAVAAVAAFPGISDLLGGIDWRSFATTIQKGRLS